MFVMGTLTASTNTQIVSKVTGSGTSTSAFNTESTGGGPNGWIMIRGMVENTDATSGTFKIQFANGTAVASKNTQANKYSYLIARKM